MSRMSSPPRHGAGQGRSVARTASARHAPSNRPLKVGETVRHALDSILRRGEVHDAGLARHNITVTEVRMAPDLAHAIVFVTPLGGQMAKEMLADLKRCQPMLRTEVAHIVKLRHAPELHFQLDTSFDYAGSIESMLHSNPVVARDLKAAAATPARLSDHDDDEG